MSKLLSLADEQHKIRRYMTAPLLTQIFSVPARGHPPPMHAMPIKVVHHINLAHYPEHVDHPMVWRAIREAVKQGRHFTWY